MAWTSGIISALKVFYSPEPYRDTVRNGEGVNGLYLFTLLAVCLIPWALLFHHHINNFSQYYHEKVADQMPMFKIIDGKISIDKPIPYTIMDKAANRPIMVINTVSTPTFENQEADYYITESQVFERISKDQFQAYDLSSVKSFTLTPAEIESSLKSAHTWFYLIGFPLVIIGVFLYHLLKALLLGVFCVIIGKIMSVSVEYKQAVRLCVFAITPSIIISMFCFYLQCVIPFQGLVYLFLSLGYMIFGLVAVKNR